MADVGRTEKSSSGFQRSYSLPPSQIIHMTSIGTQSSKNHNCNDKDAGTSLLNRIGSMRNKFRVSKKTDIRVSKFEPLGILLPDDVIATIHDVEERSSMDGLRSSNLSNGKALNENLNFVNNQTQVSTKDDKRIRHTENGIQFLKFRPSTSRRTSKSKLPSFTKNVEIIRNPGERLGIFIRKRHVSEQTDSAIHINDVRKKNNKLNVREGIFVSKLLPSCMAAQRSLLHVGDEIMAVNTISVSKRDIKTVAAIMCQFQRLVLTIRTTQNSPTDTNENFLVSIAPDYSEKKKRSVSLASLPEEQETDKAQKREANTAPTVFSSTTRSDHSDVKHSMYDNNLDIDAGTANAPLLSQNSIIQSKFDESVQILLDAIANCAKSSITKDRNTSIEDEFDPKLGSHELNHSKDNVSNSSDKDSLLSEILQTVNKEDQWKLYSSSSNQNSDFENPASFHDYDEVESPQDSDSLVLSNSSSFQEVNLDEVYSNYVDSRAHRSTLQHSRSLNPSAIPAISCNSPGADTVKFFPSDLDRTNRDRPPPSACTSKLHASDSDISQNALPNSYSNVFNKMYAHNVPKFPVTLSDASSNVINLMEPLMDRPQQRGNVTVDKKREWLNSGKLVSDELKKRLDGDSNEKTNFAGLFHATFQKPSGQQMFYEKFNHNMSTNTATPPASSRFYFDVSSTATTCSCPNSAVTVRRKDSMRSPVEKSVKSLFSVSPLPSKSSKRAASNEDLNENGGNVASNADNLSPTLLDDSAKELKSPDQQKNKSDALKVTSPNRSRKKNWKKITKKFRLPGNADVGMSEYTCWNPEDTINQSPTNEEKSSPEPIKQQDTAVTNHYHLDSGMTNQRRLSRQLFLDNKNREVLQKSLNVSQFQKYKPLPVIGNTNLPLVDGCLVITLYGVKELKKGLCEAYCIVQVDDAATKRIGTTMQTCKGATTWNQCFEMIISQAKNLNFTVYTWDTRGGKHKASSRAVINLPLLLQGGKSSFAYSNRLAVSLEPRGTLYVRLALEKSPSSSGPLLFGADLQSIADRENGPSVVPTLVRSSIAEVEQRGMHVVGIYRLCGSAIVKKDLRRKLEEKGGKVELDASSYPDINVITGILKDFLRELPNPLFPPELLEVVTSTMEELPGPSSHAVIKEPFSPNQTLFTSTNRPGDVEHNQDHKNRSEVLMQKINNLPASSAEKTTLYALMNHLKKVSLHSDKNKMTCQNLAVCFGPVLLGPVSSSPASRMDLNAAIGFKRHIQVLNYMMSNWPEKPVPYIPASVVTRRKEKIAADRDSYRVSLTRRLSRVCVEEMEVDGEEGTVIKTSDLQTDPRASLAGIPEDGGIFRDPEIYPTTMSQEL